MAVRGDDVASSIDSHVREAIEKMVGEIRSSVEDVREIVDQQLKAVTQSVQADVNAISLLPHIKKSIADLEESLRPAKAPAGADASRVKNAVQAVEQGKSQVDILNALLEQSVQFGSRAALLILRGETFSGWKGTGFSSHGGNDENVKRFNAAPGLIPELDRVLRYEHVVIWDGNNLSSRLGVSGSVRAILVPMVIKDKVAAAMYVDVVEDDLGNFDPTSIELLVFTTGLLVDTLAIRKKIPSPSLSEAGESTGAVSAPGRSCAPSRAGRKYERRMESHCRARRASGRTRFDVDGPFPRGPVEPLTRLAAVEVLGRARPHALPPLRHPDRRQFRRLRSLPPHHLPRRGPHRLQRPRRNRRHSRRPPCQPSTSEKAVRCRRFPARIGRARSSSRLRGFRDRPVRERRPMHRKSTMKRGDLRVCWSRRSSCTTREKSNRDARTRTSTSG